MTQDRLTRLREFGLSEYAARSYLALLDLGIAEARDVSSLSKVPQAKIYHVLEQLHDKGLVVILPEFPKKYAPVPFEEYLGRLFDEHSKIAQSIEEQRSELAELFRVKGDTGVGDRGFFTVIRGRRNVLSKIEEIVGLTREDLVVLGTTGTASRAPSMAGELRRARERGVRLRFLAPVTPDTIEQLAGLAGFSELRAREVDEAEQSAKVAIVVSDASRAFLIHFVPDDANLYAGKDIGVFTDQEAMVAAIQALVEPHWARATTYARRAEELLLGRAPEFTRVYGTLAEARVAIRATLARGAEEVCALNGFSLEERTSPARWRVVTDVRDLGAVEALERLAKSPGAFEARHLRAPMVSQQLLIDDREAFFSLGGRAEDGGEVVIHTSAPQVVKALRAQFESVWTLSSSLEERARELQIFPGLQPGDVGIGRLFHLLRDAVVVTDASGAVVLWNPAAQQMFGRDQVLGVPLGSLVAPGAREAFLERVKRFREGEPASGESASFETEATRPSGAFPLEIMVSVLPTSEATQHLVFVMRDITTRRRALEAEREINARVQRAYERMTEAFYALDKDWRFVYRNAAVRTMQRSKPDGEIDGKVIWETYPDLVGTRFETEFRRAMREVRAVKFEEHYPRLDMWFEVSAYPSEEGLSVYFRDVTERKRHEADQRRAASLLQQAEERLRQVVEHSSNLFYIHTPEHVLTYVSPQAREFFDCEPEEALTRWTEFATDHPVNAAGMEATERAIRTGQRQPPYELELVGRKGRPIWVLVDEAPVVRGGTTVAVVGALTDITARKEAEAALGRSEERFERAFVDAPVPMAISDASGKLVQVNGAFASLLGYAERDLIGRRVLDIVRPEQHAACAAETARLMTGATESILVAKDYVHRSGSLVPVKARLSVIHDASGRPMEILAHVGEFPDGALKRARAKKL